MNSVTLTGNLTRDVEVRYTAGGTAVTDITVAVNDRKKVGDQWQDVATFVDVTLWGKTAENAGQYLSKGKKVGIVGKLAQDQWEDKQTGAKRSKLKVIADTVEFLSAPRGPEDQRPPTENYGEEPQTPPLTESGEDVPF